MVNNTRLPSIRGRLIQSLLWSSVAFGLLTALVVWFVIAHEMGELMDQELRETSEIFHNVLAAQPGFAYGASSATQHFDSEKHLIWQVVDASTGQVRGRSHKAPATALQTAPTAQVAWTADGRWRAFSSAFPQSPRHFLVVAQSRQERNEARSEVVLYTLVAALSMGLFSALWMNWRIRQELRPLAALSHDVQRYDPLHPDTAPRVEPRAELLPIEQSIADLGHRLARRIVSERAFTAHAAHALRTPVAGIDVQLALAIKEAPEPLQPRLQRAREAAGRLGRAMQALLTKQNVKLVAMADAFRDNIDRCYKALNADDISDITDEVKNVKNRIDVPEERKFVGFDAYKHAIAAADVVLLTTPPGFRPIHFEEAVKQNKHIFMEKPVATDPAPYPTRTGRGSEAAPAGPSVLIGSI